MTSYSKKLILVISLIPLILFLATSPLFAEKKRIQVSQPIKPNFAYNFVHRHNIGFTTSLDLGITYAQIKSTKFSDDRNFKYNVTMYELSSGVALYLMANAGGNILDNFALEASFFSILQPPNGLLGLGITTRYWLGSSGLALALTTGPVTVEIPTTKQTYLKNLGWAVQPQFSYSIWTSDHIYFSIKAIGGLSPFNTNRKTLIWWTGAALSLGYN